MKIAKQYLEFPKTLPNDIEGFLFYYPRKFPLIVGEYKKAAQMVAESPDNFRKYGNLARDELFLGFEKIKKDYEKGNQEDLEFLLSIDQRFNKLICYRFWIVNYLFADGPLHDFFVDNIKNSVNAIADIGGSVDEFEKRALEMQMDLLQGEYADLYLQQAIDGFHLIEGIKKEKALSDSLEEIFRLIDNKKSEKEINRRWDKIIEFIEKEKGSLLENVSLPLRQVKMRDNMAPLYNMLTHAVEFREENKKLAERDSKMMDKIGSIMRIARGKLKKEEFDKFQISYEQISNMARYKDVMGEIDCFLLPVWFGVHDQMRNILIKNGVKIPKRNTGHAAAFYFFVWYLPDNLKVKIMSIDNTPFDIEKI